MCYQACLCQPCSIDTVGSSTFRPGPTKGLCNCAQLAAGSTRHRQSLLAPCLSLTDKQLVLQEVWLDQEDVQLLHEGEEITLMDWGNAFVEVSACRAVLSLLWLVPVASGKRLQSSQPVQLPVTALQLS